MGEEKKENDTRAMLQEYIELGKKLNTEKVMESYAYMHGQLETLRRWKLYQVGSQYGSVYRGIDERGDIVTRQEQEDQEQEQYLAEWSKKQKEKREKKKRKFRLRRNRK